MGYSNPDHDPRGDWKAIPFTNRAMGFSGTNLRRYDHARQGMKHTGATRKAWRNEQTIYLKI